MKEWQFEGAVRHGLGTLVVDLIIECSSASTCAGFRIDAEESLRGQKLSNYLFKDSASLVWPLFY